MSEKRFDATPSRLARAKREGDLAISAELSSVAGFAAGLMAVAGVVAPLSASVRNLLEAAAGNRSTVQPFFEACTWMLLPALAAALSSAACSVAQSGGIHIVAVALSMRRLSPNENLKRMFSREAVVTAVRATLAFACAACAIVPSAAAIYAGTLHASAVSGIAQAAWGGVLRAGAVACAVGGIFAGIDYALQVARRRKRLRMSFEDLKRDHKEHEGDPLARGRRRALHRAIARSSVQRVKEAAFVVTNPTHLAIALEYAPPQVPVPRVLVRAADEVAAAVRDAAREHGVPLIENVSLARELYAKTKAGEFIPQETYVAVAEIVGALKKSGVLN